MKNHYFKSIWVIALNSYKEIIRDKVLYGLMLIAFLVTGSIFFLSTISMEQNSRILQNIGLSAIHVFTLFILIFVTTNSIFKDLDGRALYMLFAKPISRAQYILGKYFGMILLLFTTLGLLGGLFIVGLLFIDRSIVIGSLISFTYTAMEACLITALTVLFASFTAPLNASLYSVAFFIIGHSLDMMKKYVAELGNRGVIWLMDFCYYLLPNLEKFNVRTAVLYDMNIPWQHIVWSFGYFAIYTAGLLVLAVVVMNKREV